MNPHTVRPSVLQAHRRNARVILYRPDYLPAVSPGITFAHAFEYLARGTRALALRDADSDSFSLFCCSTNPNRILVGFYKNKEKHGDPRYFLRSGVLAKLEEIELIAGFEGAKGAPLRVACEVEGATRALAALITGQLSVERSSRWVRPVLRGVG